MADSADKESLGSKSPPKEGNCALVHKVDIPNFEYTIMVRGVK
jgi:hypothetical protein